MCCSEHMNHDDPCWPDRLAAAAEQMMGMKCTLAADMYR